MGRRGAWAGEMFGNALRLGIREKGWEREALPLAREAGQVRCKAGIYFARACARGTTLVASLLDDTSLASLVPSRLNRRCNTGLS